MDNHHNHIGFISTSDVGIHVCDVLGVDHTMQFNINAAYLRSIKVILQNAAFDVISVHVLYRDLPMLAEAGIDAYTYVPLSSQMSDVEA